MTTNSSAAGMPGLLQSMQAEIEGLRADNEALKRLGGSDGPFIASRRRTTFHRLDCKWAMYLGESNAFEFSTHDEAVEAGYRPCRTCRA